jgi:hypothetical protein
VAKRKPAKRKPAAKAKRPAAAKASRKAAAPKRRKKAAAAKVRRIRPIVPAPAPSAEELATLGDSISERAIEHFGGETDAAGKSAQPAVAGGAPGNGSSPTS